MKRGKRLYAFDSGGLVPGAIVLIRLSAVVIWISFAIVSSPSIPRAEESGPLKRLADWVLTTGKPSVVRSHIAEAMNLPASDTPVRERGFRHEGERITHVCAVSTAATLRDLMFFAQVDESDGSAIVWKTSLSGRITHTVQFSNGIVERVPNERFKAQFETEKIIFLTRMRMQATSPQNSGK